MKILSIKALNINSLKGKTEINFEELTKDGALFAITGPTGSGKSTILDIISCALYGRTARLKNPNDLMSRHSGEAYCEVEFEIRGKAFRSSWSQKRARNKHDGASAINEVLSQILKNIARAYALIEAYKDTFESKWKDTYQSTDIPRTTKNGNRLICFNEMKESLETIYSNPSSKRQVYLATPFFSKKEMTNKLNNLIDNDSSNPHYIQLNWLLSSFITLCQD